MRSRGQEIAIGRTVGATVGSAVAQNMRLQLGLPGTPQLTGHRRLPVLAAPGPASRPGRLPACLPACLPVIVVMRQLPLLALSVGPYPPARAQQGAGRQPEHPRLPTARLSRESRHASWTSPPCPRSVRQGRRAWSRENALLRQAWPRGRSLTARTGRRRRTRGRRGICAPAPCGAHRPGQCARTHRTAAQCADRASTPRQVPDERTDRGPLVLASPAFYCLGAGMSMPRGEPRGAERGRSRAQTALGTHAHRLRAVRTTPVRMRCAHREARDAPHRPHTLRSGCARRSSHRASVRRPRHTRSRPNWQAALPMPPCQERADATPLPPRRPHNRLTAPIRQDALTTTGVRGRPTV